MTRVDYIMNRPGVPHRRRLRASQSPLLRPLFRETLLKFFSPARGRIRGREGKRGRPEKSNALKKTAGQRDARESLYFARSNISQAVCTAPSSRLRCPAPRVCARWPRPRPLHYTALINSRGSGYHASKFRDPLSATPRVADNDVFEGTIARGLLSQARGPRGRKIYV